MMKNLILLSFLFVIGCSESDMSDLEIYVSDTMDKPKGRIKPLPEFKPYSAFSYSASSMRSPFESPVAFEESADMGLVLVDAPDTNRRKDTLEGYKLSTLTLVGTLSKNETDLQALIKTTSGGVHMLETGQYIGLNNGLVVNVSENKIDILEVVPNGSGGWISRPQTMGMKVPSGAN